MSMVKKRGGVGREVYKLGYRAACVTPLPLSCSEAPLGISWKPGVHGTPVLAV